MKKLLIIFFLATVAMTGCKKDKDTVSKTVDVSYPTINLKGDKYISIPVGGSYTDEGATGIDDISGAQTDIMAESSTLDASTPGLYYMSYSAKNANGYITHVGRYIAVTDYADDIPLEGIYERTTNGITVNLTRVAKGLYMTDDMGGAGLPDAGYFAVIDDSTIDFGPQLSESLGTEISGSGGSLSVTATDTSYSYALDAPGYGTQSRTFVKVQP